MDLSFITSFFKKKKKKLTLPESILTKKLKLITARNGLLVYQNVTIYHHTQSFFIPLLILDLSRGLYLFEYKEWSFTELRNAKVQKASQQDTSENTLAFEKAHTIIKQRFNELTHSDGVPIYNYLLMENLNATKYEHLDISFQELLPFEKIIFSDSTHADIIKKLQNSSPTLSLPTASSIIGSILIQYCIISKEINLNLCTKEQMQFIDSDISGHSTLKAPTGSGRTSILVLKAILEKLKNPQVKIIIIKPTLLSCEILKKKLLATIEHAIVEIDITSIEIITPIQLINRHLSKLSKPLLEETLHVDNIVMKKRINIADLLLCDDADMFPNEFILYLKHIQKKSTLLLVSSEDYATPYHMKDSFRLSSQKFTFLKTNPHAKALQLVSKLLETQRPQDILVISNSLSREKLNEDLESFIKDKAVLLDSSKNLINQDINNLLLSTYNDINGINAKYIILMDVCFAPQNELNYALHLCEEEVYILYDEDCEQIRRLKDNHESN